MAFQLEPSPGQASFAPLRVAGRGMCCAVGFNARPATAAINARMNHFRETQFVGAGGAPIVGAALFGIDYWGGARLAAMLTSVVKECLAGKSPIAHHQVAIVLLTAEAGRPGMPSEDLANALDDLTSGRRPGFGPFHSGSRLCAFGKGGVARALDACARLLAEPDGPWYVVLAAVDSFLNAGPIEHYLGQDRIATTSNADGFIPAEGAAALLLCRRADAGAGSLWIDAVATREDPWRIDGDTPLRGQALAEAIREAARQAGTEVAALDFHASGMTGESWYAKEINLALARVLERRVAEYPHHIIAASLGETGAAAPLLTLAWLADVMGRETGPGRRALLHFAGDDGQRAAMIATYRQPRDACPPTATKHGNP